MNGVRVIAWGGAALLMGATTALFVWDVFGLRTPPRNPPVALPGQPLAASSVALDLEVEIVNPTSHSIAYFYTWNAGRVFGRVIDSQSVPGRKYPVRVRLSPEGLVLFDDSWGLEFAGPLQSGPLSVGVTFERHSGDVERVSCECRYEAWVSPDNVALADPGQPWTFSHGAWSTTGGTALVVHGVRSYERDLGQRAAVIGRFTAPRMAADVKTALASALPDVPATAVHVLPVYEEGRFTDDVGRKATVFELGYSVPRAMAPLPAPRPLQRLKTAVVAAFPEALSSSDLRDWNPSGLRVAQPIQRVPFRVASDAPVVRAQLARWLRDASAGGRVADPLLWPAEPGGARALRPLRDYRMSIVVAGGTWEPALEALAQRIAARAEAGEEP
ncbi:MAG TPA: hypothetical protein P5567_08690 [Kiritimatiellia bacterium]|nr:hypothetical protein [Kiritimatiellia bacterium]HRZ12519.1 hypothetical protein [Kiritimatiellia bacterium]HSA17723.1 hypothetical protein [Kiritimatiellia bacterium]